VDQAQEARQAWSESDVEHFTRALEESFDELVETFSSGDLPADCRGMAGAVTELGREWSRWKDVAESSGDPNLLPDLPVWKALDTVQEMRRQATPRDPVKLESIEELTRQKVPDRQIALIYGFDQDDGSPALAMVREEREEPGMHTGEGTGWLPPVERERQEETRRRAEIAERVRAREEAKLEQLARVAPESLSELVEEGVTAPQIARMLKIDVAEVYARCEAEGLSAPPASYPSGHAMRGVHDKDPSEAEERILDAMSKPKGIEAMEPIEPMEPLEAMTMEPAEDAGEGAEPPGPMTLEEEIIYYSNTTDWSAQEIAEAVGTEDVPVTRQKVTGVLKRYGERPEALETAAAEGS